MALRIGVDCGGTNTDAAVLAADGMVLGWAKHKSTEDVLTGVVAAVKAALESAGQGECAALPAAVRSRAGPAPSLPAASTLRHPPPFLAATDAAPAAVGAVMLGTTQFVNACIQHKGLARVAVVRLCGPATRSLPPLCDMPPALRQAVGGCYFFAAGGPYLRE